MWRVGKPVAPLRAFHGISFSLRGLALLCGNELLDLGGRFPQQLRQIEIAERWVRNDSALHPDGDRVIVFDAGASFVVMQPSVT